MKILIYLSLIFVLVFASCKNPDNVDNTVATTSNDPVNIPFTVIGIYPHDTAAFTEGLFFQNGDLYESTGGDKSFIIKRSLKSEEPIKKMDLAKSLFGEGITILDGKLFQLTWRDHKVFVYDANTWQKLKEFTWSQEGWGMTTDGKSLILSTGNSNLYYVNPNNFKVEKIVGVFNNYGPKSDINELEYVDGIYANVYHANDILKIDPSTGKILGVLDLSNINQKNGINFTPHDESILNGIAYNPSTKTFFVTGKNWPNIFEIRL